MNKPTQGQVLNAVAVLMNNADWDVVSGAVLQAIIDNPRVAGSQFTAFLNNGGRVIRGVPKCTPIDRTSAFDPVAFIGKGWSIVEEDKRSLDLLEIDLADINLKTMVKDLESYVRGGENLNRLKRTGYIRLDAKVFQCLWENQDLIPENWKENTNLDVTLVFFDGTVLRSPEGDCCVLCLCWFNSRWTWEYFRLSDKWVRRYPSAVLAS